MRCLDCSGVVMYGQLNVFKLSITVLTLLTTALVSSAQPLSYESYLEQAEGGNPYAQFVIGEMYF